MTEQPVQYWMRSPVLMVGAMASAAALLAGCAASEPRPTPPTGVHSSTTQSLPPMSLAFGDEFDGTKLDRSKWEPATGMGGGSNKLGCRRDDPSTIAVHGGMLHLVARPGQVDCGSTTAQWSTASLSTEGLFAQEYGRWEVRAKAPQPPFAGFLPAAWMRPTDHQVGEIDIVEFPSPAAGQPQVAHMAAHHDYTGTYLHVNAQQPIDASFHTYAVQWSPTQMSWSVDGKVVFVVHQEGAPLSQHYDPGVKVAALPWYGQAFRREYFLRLDLQVTDSAWAGTPAAKANQPVEFVVDYVRVFAPSTNAGGQSDPRSTASAATPARTKNTGRVPFVAR